MSAVRRTLNIKTYFKTLLLCAFERLLWCAFIYVVFFAALRSLTLAIPAFVVGMCLIMTARFYLSYQLSCMIRPRIAGTVLLSSVPHLLLASFVRMVCALLWSIPFLALITRLYQYVFVFPMTTWTKEFTAIGAFVFPDESVIVQVNIGTIIFFALLALMLFLAIYGWRRGLAFEFQQVNDLPLNTTLRNARYARKISRWRMFGYFWLHVLVCLPALIVPLLLPYLKLAPMLSGKIMNDLQSIFVFLQAGMVSDGTLILSLIAFVLLYIPVLPWRKLHVADAMVNSHDRRKKY